jgi:hypothetical protein
MADIPVIDTGKPQVGFLPYLVDTLLSNPRTQAQIGSAARSILIMFGSSWAATHGDALNLASGVLLAAVAAVWGLYQKWSVAREMQTRPPEVKP